MKLGVLGLAVALLGACRAAPEELVPGASSRSAGEACPAGATKIAELGFCIALPEGYLAGAASADEPGKLTIAFESARGSGGRFVVRATDDTLADVDDSLLDPAKNRIKGKGELLGGKGRWFYSTSRAGKGASVGVYVEGPKKLYTCELAGGADGPELQRTLDICKTITPLASGPLR